MALGILRACYVSWMFLFRLLRFNGLYMFRALLAHPRRRCTDGTWYIACVLCQLAAPELEWNWCSRLT
jgi:hypothetical protein